MKKIFISLLIPAIFLWAKNIAYSDEVVSLYLNKDDAKVIENYFLLILLKF